LKTNSDFEKVHVELSWYDGPREGVADVFGIACRFKSLFDASKDDLLDTFIFCPINVESLALEIEAWNIFVAWNIQYESGEADISTHPGVGGVSPRYDEIEKVLMYERNNMPNDCARATAEFLRLERDRRYDIDGPDYRLKWKLWDGI